MVSTHAKIHAQVKLDHFFQGLNNSVKTKNSVKITPWTSRSPIFNICHFSRQIFKLHGDSFLFKTFCLLRLCNGLQLQARGQAAGISSTSAEKNSEWLENPSSRIRRGIYIYILYCIYFLLKNGDFPWIFQCCHLSFHGCMFFFEMHVLMRIFPSGRISVTLV